MGDKFAAVLPALVIRCEAVKADPALAARGQRKILVTSLYAATEEPAREPVWRAQQPPARCPVQVMANAEVAVFTERSSQQRHYHRQGTELYEVLEGQMVIEVEGAVYRLEAGDLIVVNAGAAHEVRSAGTRFLCRVVCLNCGGAGDKVLAPGV